MKFLRKGQRSYCMPKCTTVRLLKFWISVWVRTLPLRFGG